MNKLTLNEPATLFRELELLQILQKKKFYDLIFQGF